MGWSFDSTKETADVMPRTNNSTGRNLPISRKQVLPLALGLAAVFPAADSRADPLVFHVNPTISKVDLTAFAYVFFSGPRTTRDTQTMPLGGTISLDVEEVGGSVQSVDFVSLDFDYLADPQNPTIHRRILLNDNTLEELSAGEELEVRLPFIEDLAHGNPTQRFPANLIVSEFSAGVETGSGAELLLTSPGFEFEATGQYFGIPYRTTDPDDPTSQPHPFQDGFPMNYGPYPTGTSFPSMMPGEEYLPELPDNTTMEPSPSGPDWLGGTVSIVDGVHVLRGTLFTRGVGGGGIAQTAQIHEACFFASTSPFLPGDFNDDGVVDAADYTVWRDNFGAPAGALKNDIDGGPIGLDQYRTWKKTFGGALPSYTGPSHANVAPEPSSLVIALAALLCVRGRRATL